jgi:hypothetical protein
MASQQFAKPRGILEFGQFYLYGFPRKHSSFV